MTFYGFLLMLNIDPQNCINVCIQTYTFKYCSTFFTSFLANYSIFNLKEIGEINTHSKLQLHVQCTNLPYLAVFFSFE